MESLNKTLWEQKIKEKNENHALIRTGFIFVIIFLLLIMSMLRFYVVQVHETSMVPTLNDGDYLIVDSYATPNCGDVVIIQNVLEKNGNPYLIIKRVIAKGGDTVDIRGGHVYVNDHLEPNYFPNVPDTSPKENLSFPLVVPEGEVFYLGDNRTGSRDSRDFGTCKEKDIVGVVPNSSISIKGVLNFFFNIFSFGGGCGNRSGN